MLKWLKRCLKIEVIEVELEIRAELVDISCGGTSHKTVFMWLGSH